MTFIAVDGMNEVYMLECVVDGIDILADVMGGAGVEHNADTFFLYSEDELNWWKRWAEREELICAAYDEADEETRAAHESVVLDYCHDMELLQYHECELFGIEY